MPATLNIQLVNPTFSSIQDDVRAAFTAWLSHFDYTTGSYSVTVNFGRITGGIGSSVGYSGDAYAQLGSAGGTAVVLPVFGLNVAGRNGTTPVTPALTFSINQVGDGATIRSNLLREFEHAFGVQSFRGSNASFAPAGSQTVYDGSINVVPYPPGTYFSSYGPPPGPNLAFAGPSAQEVYGGPVPLLAPLPEFTAGHEHPGRSNRGHVLGTQHLPATSRA